MPLPIDARARKDIPIARGVLDYFPNAIAAVAEVSMRGNEQHNPGQPLHWAREKSTDQADCIARHLIERGSVDSDGMRHSAKLAWRALALLQLELEDAERLYRDGADGNRREAAESVVGKSVFGMPIGRTSGSCGCNPTILPGTEKVVTSYETGYINPDPGFAGSNG